MSAPATDVLIVACAHVHGADIVHADADFDRIVEEDRGQLPPPARARKRQA